MSDNISYDQMAAVYDLVYEWKDYVREAAMLRWIIAATKHSGGVQHFIERLEMGLFTHDEYLAAFTRNGLSVTFDAYGLMGRGLYIGVKA